MPSLVEEILDALSKPVERKMGASNASTIERKLDLIINHFGIEDPLDLEKKTAGAEAPKPVASDANKGGQDAKAAPVPVASTPVVVPPVVASPTVATPATPQPLPTPTPATT
jgi:hypothetical protein